MVRGYVMCVRNKRDLLIKHDKMKRRQRGVIISRQASVRRAKMSRDAISENDLSSTLICRGGDDPRYRLCSTNIWHVHLHREPRWISRISNEIIGTSIQGSRFIYVNSECSKRDETYSINAFTGIVLDEIFAMLWRDISSESGIYFHGIFFSNLSRHSSR